VPGQFLSPRFKPHSAPLATYQYTFPNTIHLATLFTTILFYHNSPALYVTTTAAAYGGQNASVKRGEAKTKGGPPCECSDISIRDRLTKIPRTLESLTAGFTVSRRGNAMLGPASSRLEIPEPVPDNREPVLDNWEQGLEPADDSIDSDNGEYKGQSQES